MKISFLILSFIYGGIVCLPINLNAQLAGSSWQYKQSIERSFDKIVELNFEGKQKTIFLVENDQHKNFRELKGFTDNEIGLVCTDQKGETQWYKRITVATQNSQPFSTKLVANNDFLLIHISSNTLQSVQYEGKNITIDSSGNAFLFVNPLGEIINFSLLNSSKKPIQFKVSSINIDGSFMIAFFVNEPLQVNGSSVEPLIGIHSLSLQFNNKNNSVIMNKPICIVETTNPFHFSFSTRTLYSDKNIDLMYLYELTDTISILSSIQSDRKKVYNIRYPSKENPCIAIVHIKDEGAFKVVPLHFYLNDIKTDSKGNIHLLTEFQTRIEEGWKYHSVYHVYTKDFSPLFKDTLYGSKTIFDVDHEGNAILVRMKEGKEEITRQDTVLTISNNTELVRISSHTNALPYKLNFKKINSTFETDFEYTIDNVDKIAEYKTVKILQDGSISLKYFAKAKNMLLVNENQINSISNDKFGYCTTLFKMRN
jgi:hypothetical protein